VNVSLETYVAMIEVENLGFSYGNASPTFEGFDLTVGRGEAWTVIGPSGCGKTTLLYLLAGLRRPSTGKIRITGERLARPRPRTGVVLQDHGLLPWATVRENTRLGLTIRSLYGPDGRHAPEDEVVGDEEAERRVNHWLAWLGIDHLQAKYPAQLSRGQRQRTAIARTLVLAPDLLLMDEPFAALDAPIRLDLQDVMADFHRETSLTSITVTHDIAEAVFLGQKILVLKGDRNRDSRVVTNDLAGGPGVRGSSLFRGRCEEVRQLLGRRP
jgi:NitT/TauT family transport system ATP-binding protein